VPEVTIAFWVTKVLTTGIGETAADFLFQNLAPPIAVAIGLVGLVTALVLQFRAPRYVPWIYWFAVAMVSVFGTMAADVAHVGQGIPYLASTAFFLPSPRRSPSAWSSRCPRNLEKVLNPLLGNHWLALALWGRHARRDHAGRPGRRLGIS
jgi:uncharacterized membrane-anchored protein